MDVIVPDYGNDNLIQDALLRAMSLTKLLVSDVWIVYQSFNEDCDPLHITKSAGRKLRLLTASIDFESQII